MDECIADNCHAPKHPHKRFCVNGHDTFVEGRGEDSWCSACEREHAREYWHTERGREIQREYERSPGRLEYKRKRYAANPLHRVKTRNRNDRNKLIKAIQRDEALIRELIAEEYG